MTLTLPVSRVSGLWTAWDSTNQPSCVSEHPSCYLDNRCDSWSGNISLTLLFFCMVQLDRNGSGERPAAGKLIGCLRSYHWPPQTHVAVSHVFTWLTCVTRGTYTPPQATLFTCIVCGYKTSAPTLFWKHLSTLPWAQVLGEYLYVCVFMCVCVLELAHAYAFSFMCVRMCVRLDEKKKRRGS